MAGLVLAGSAVLVAPTIASALPGAGGGQPRPGAPAVHVDPDSIAKVPAQPAANAKPVQVKQNQIAPVPAQPVNQHPQKAKPMPRPKPEPHGVSSGPDAHTGVSSAPE